MTQSGTTSSLGIIGRKKIGLRDAGKDAMFHHVIATGRAARTAVMGVAQYRLAPSIVMGAALGIIGWSAAHPFIAAFGFNRETTAGLLMAAAGSFAFGVNAARLRPGLSASQVPDLVAATWLVLLPWSLSLAVWLVTSVPVEWLAMSAISGMALAVAALLVFGVSAACTGLMADRYRRRGEGVTFLAGAGLGIIANALFFAPHVGLQVPLLVVAVLAAVRWFAHLVKGASPRPPEQPPVLSSSRKERGSIIASACFAVLVGAGCAVSSRVLAQLMLETSALIAFGAATFLCGMSIGGVLVVRVNRNSREATARRRVAGVIAACSVFVPLAVFPWLIDRHLDANAFISSVFWLSLVRYATIAGTVLPLGVGCGLFLSPALRAGTIAVSLAGGFVATGWLLPVIGLIPLALAAGCGLVVTSAGKSGIGLPRSRAGWATAAVCGILLAVTAANVGRFEPARAAGLLFNTETFLARQGGIPRELLPFAGDARLLASHVSSVGTVTVWRKRGDLSIVRIDGVPVATTSLRPDRCPLPSADVMRVALPLLLHHDADSVLVLGDPALVATTTAARFPVRQIVGYDVMNGAADDVAALSADERISFSALEPRLALGAQRQSFDVIVSDPGTPSLPSAAPYFTQEFYATVSAGLTDAGIFCQRMRYADYGPEPLKVVAATMQRVFGEVMTVEIGSGDYALLGVRRGQSLVRDGLLDRLQRPHARRVLASLGWDWCVPLNLTSVENEAMASLASGAWGPNSDSNGLLAYTLPQETMRWGAKWRELQAATVGKTSRLAMRGVPPEEQEDVLVRIADVTRQHRLMTAFPDQPWAYRKDVRTQLAEKPRGIIRPVSGEVLRERHPDDRRRIDYFKALGKAIHETNTDNLVRLEQFAEPYDPLLTYFLHHEVAPLYAGLGDAGTAREFAHRLYAAYFSDPKDRSVRDVAATLELLAAKPELIDDDAERFDHFNGLLEVMLDRWESRGLAEPRSPEVVMIDIDISLDAIEATLDTMTPIAASAGFSNADWQLRKAAIERALTRPLRKYRTSLLPHLRAAQRKTAEAEAADDEDDSIEDGLPARELRPAVVPAG